MLPTQLTLRVTDCDPSVGSRERALDGP